MPRRCVNAPASVQEPHQIQFPQRSRSVVAQEGEAGQLLAGFHRLPVALSVTSASARPLSSLATSESDGFFGIGIVPGKIQNRIRKLSAFFLIQLANFQEDARQDFLIQFRVARGRNGRPFPLQPARGVDERSVFFGESRAGQAINLGLDVLHLVGSDAREISRNSLVSSG